MDIKSIEREWMEVKSEYQDLINKRTALLDEENYTELTNQNGGITKYFPEEKQLFRKSEELRKKLIKLDPKNYHYGWKNLVKGNKKKVGKYSIQGDHGYFTCFECHKLFETETAVKHLKRSGQTGRRKKGEERHERGAFLKCRFHAGLKPKFQMIKRFIEGEF